MTADALNGWLSTTYNVHPEAMAILRQSETGRLEPVYGPISASFSPGKIPLVIFRQRSKLTGALSPQDIDVYHGPPTRMLPLSTVRWKLIDLEGA